MKKKLYTAINFKTLSKHVRGTKIVHISKYEAVFVVCDEAQDINKLRMFLLLACYIGAVYADQTGKGKMWLPAKMVLELLKLSSPLRFDDKVLTQSHNQILDYAERLLADSGIFESGDKRRKFSLAFDLLGKDIKDFKTELRLTLHWCF